MPFYVLFTHEAQFTDDGVSNTINCHLWVYGSLYRLAERNFEHRFSVNMWCDIIGDQVIGSYIFMQRLAGEFTLSSCKMNCRLC